MVAELAGLMAEHTSKKAMIACVSHADMIKLAVAHFVGLPLDLFQRLVVDPASVSAVGVFGGHIRLLKLNDTSAVRDLQGAMIYFCQFRPDRAAGAARPSGR